MNRRNFVKGAAGATVVVAAVKVDARGIPADWQRIADETNTFDSDDTLDVRLRKFNQLTSMRLRILGPSPKSTYCFVCINNKYTGWMNEETMMHWMAQVGLGYRLAKAQGA